MGVKYTNNAEGTLTAGLLIGATTNLTLTAGDGLLFPTIVSGAGDYFWATLIDTSDNLEIIKVTEHQSGTDVFQAFTRAQDDTSARAYSIGDKVELRIPKIILEDFRDDIDTNETNITSNDVDIAALDARITINETDLAGTTNPATVPAPSGVKMFFYQDTAPTTWTLDSGPADSLLAVKGGSQAYNAAGGQVKGTWTPTTHTHTGPSHTHTGPSHTHTGPSHYHSGPYHTHTFAANTNTPSAWTTLAFGSNSGGATVDHYHYVSGNTGGGGTGATGWEGTGNTGSSGTGATGAEGTGATGTGSAPSTDRPQAGLGIIATKD